jgi:hypothetical protein
MYIYILLYKGVNYADGSLLALESKSCGFHNITETSYLLDCLNVCGFPRSALHMHNFQTRHDIHIFTGRGKRVVTGEVLQIQTERKYTSIFL